MPKSLAFSLPTPPIFLFWLAVVLIGSSHWLGFITPPVALAMGLAFALAFEHPYRRQSSTTMKWLLQASVVGLGFGINFTSILHAGEKGFGFAVASIAGTLVLGWLLGNFLGVGEKASRLISVGTAICGGSAIAAIAPIIEADDAEVSVALGTVFVLNALALFIFPALGSALGLTQEQFGLWAAIAIHDTSSVVGAAAKFGAEALSTATTVKLSRALWIVPLALGAAVWMKRKRPLASASANASANAPSTTVALPYFVVLFILASLVNTFVPGASSLGTWLVPAAKTGLTLTLFLIGAGLSKKMLASVGIQPMVQGFLLWIAISAASLFAILHLL
ncbi:MAG: putative sulfate exporter family transporter [Candidatus Kapaibacterium sp.]|nr:MAG: putative sulfate exporter family transporter [Candidatus Kapabacteria bacterium]